MTIIPKVKKINELTVAVVIPCWNEEASIARCVESCLNQTHKPLQILVVDDFSSDKSAEILKSFGKKITYLKVPKRLGNKSFVQEYGLKFVTADILVATDADTILDKNFVEEIIKKFDDPKVGAVSGYVRSMKKNWLTRCRAFEYTTSQNLHKLAQNYMNFMFVIPGAAGAFRTDIFRKYLTFDHDTLTEDLDFTYKLHKYGFKIAYTRKAIVVTQDPMTLHAYINQMRRWLGGGWQNLLKHKTLRMRPAQALETSLIYIEGVVFTLLLFLVPLTNIRLTIYMLIYYFIVSFLFAIWAAKVEKRLDILLAPFTYIFLMYVNAYIFLEQMIKVVFLKERNLTWFKPERAQV